MIRRLAIALLLGLVLASCRHAVTREVFVRIPAPLPSVVVSADTVVAASPPDTVFVPRVLQVPGPERLVTRTDTVTRTVPAVVIRYTVPRPPSGFVLAGLEVSSDTIRIAGLSRDWQFLAPRRGETLAVQALGPDSLAAAVRGAPREVGVAVQFECPDGDGTSPEPPPIVPAGAGGWMRLSVWLLAAAAGGSILTALALTLHRR